MSSLSLYNSPSFIAFSLLGFQLRNGEFQLLVLRKAQRHGDVGRHQRGISLLRVSGALLLHQSVHGRHGRRQRRWGGGQGPAFDAHQWVPEKRRRQSSGLIVSIGGNCDAETRVWSSFMWVCRIWTGFDLAHGCVLYRNYNVKKKKGCSWTIVSDLVQLLL